MSSIEDRSAGDDPPNGSAALWQPPMPWRQPEPCIQLEEFHGV
jgi:hypothetical protein